MQRVFPSLFAMLSRALLASANAPLTPEILSKTSGFAEKKDTI